jgi:WD40 repeat protein
LASGSIDSTIKIWNVLTGEEVRTLEGHSDSVDAVAFSPDGRTLASGSADKSVKLWDVGAWSERTTLKGSADIVSSLAFSPDSKVIAAGSYDGMVRLWSADNGGEPRKLKGEDGGINAVAFAPNGQMVAAGTYGHTIILWEPGSGQKVHELDGYAGGFGSVAFSPDSKLLAGSYVDFSKENSSVQIKLWNATTGAGVGTLKGHAESIQAIAFSPDGKTIASGSSDQTVKLWNVSLRTETLTLKGDARAINSVAFSADGKNMASGGWNNLISVWNLAGEGKLRTLKGLPNPVGELTFSPDGATVAAATPPMLDDTDHTVRLWSIPSGVELPPLKGHTASVLTVAFSQDGKFLASGAAHPDCTIRLWNLTKGTARVLSGHTSHVNSVAFSPDGRTLASGSEDETVKVWDVDTGKNLDTFSINGSASQRQVKAVAFSPDGKWLAAGIYDGTIHLWNLTSKKELSPLKGDAESVIAVAFSPDSRTLASGGMDGVVKLWDVGTWSPRAVLSGHTEPISSLAFSPDGKILASTATIGLRTILWRTSKGHEGELASLVTLKSGDWYVVSPDGYFDTNNLDEAHGLHWVMPDDLLKALPIEIFMRDYYQPRLLPRLLAGAALPQVRPLSDLNRTQPSVSISAVNRVGRDEVEVTLTVRSTVSDTQRDRQGRPLESGVYDVRLFRDGQLVGYSTSPAKEKQPAARSNNTDDNASLTAWREANKVPLTQGRYVHTFAVRLPHRTSPGSVEFTAYAFNEDRVKSATSEPSVYPLPRTRLGVKRRAYVVTVGVDVTSDPNWRLSFAPNSARDVGRLLKNRLQGQYEVVSVPLISEYKEDGEATNDNLPTKDNIRTVLSLLSNRDPAVGQPQAFKTLIPATPDDLVVVYIASHGYAAPNGTFYVIPSDIGEPAGVSEPLLNRCLTSAERSSSCLSAQDFLGHSISSDELTQWVQDIDAGQIVLVLDSCHSGAVSGPGFKPGPMGDPGFGQLSYDKRMLVLAATQAENFAWGALELGDRSLLTDALIGQQAEDRKGPFDLRRWLMQAKEHVPALYRQHIPQGVQQEQEPELFDFVRQGSVNAN